MWICDEFEVKRWSVASSDHGGGDTGPEVNAKEDK